MNDDDLELAARWYARLEDVPNGASSRATRAGFAAWYRARDHNRRAFSAVADADGVVRELRSDPAMQSLADQALARASVRSASKVQWGLAGLVGVMVVVPVAALTIRHFAASPAAPSAVTMPTQIFATGIGQRRLITLDDATRVLLDTATRLSVSGSTLAIRGQADVTAGRSPIELQLNDARMTIRAGSFNVRVEDGRADVLAQDADAIVTLGDATSRRTVVVKRGTLLSLAGNVPTLGNASDPGAITSWQTGWLQFDDVPLPKALREINRYRQRPIRLVGDAAALRISGSFRTGGGDAFLDAVAATLPATIDQSVMPPKILVRGGPK